MTYKQTKYAIYQTFPCSQRKNLKVGEHQAATIGGTKVKEEVRIQYSRVTADFNINYYHHEKINKKQYNQWLRSHTFEPDCLDLNPSFAIY